MQLTKSDFLLFLKHPCWLWLKKHNKSLLPPVDENTQAIFDSGFLFESYAEKLFPDGVKLKWDGYQDYLSLPKRTQEAIASGAKTIFQGRFEANDLTCICDVIEFTREKELNLYEIKSSTKPQTIHEHDLAFQTIVLRALGYQVKTASVVYVNKDYVRNGEVNPHELCMVADITLNVEKRIKATEEDIKRAQDLLEQKVMPDPSPKYCKHNSHYEWTGVYKTLMGIKKGDGSIYDLYSIKPEMVLKLEDLGITKISDIPNDFELDKKRAWQLRALKEDQVIIDQKKIDNFLAEIEYPIYFLDYETLSGVIPCFDGYKPYQQIPFQYSLHIIQEPGAEPKHYEYLHKESSDPIPELSKSLSEKIGPKGSVVVWYADFEKSCNETMGKLYPDFKEFYKDINERVVDLIIPFSNYYYVDKRFGGSASIKDVLPVLVPELSHKSLAISEGGSAQRLWMEAVLDGKREGQKEKILKDLWDYCELDTLAMVRIWEFLARLQAKKDTKIPEQTSLF